MCTCTCMSNSCCFVSFVIHYEIMPMMVSICTVNLQIFLKLRKLKIFNRNIFLIYAQNIDYGNTLEPPHRLPHRGGSYEYPQSMFWSKNKKNMYTPAYPSFAI